MDDYLHEARYIDMIKIESEHKMARSFGLQLFAILSKIYFAGGNLVICEMKTKISSVWK